MLKLCKTFSLRILRHKRMGFYPSEPFSSLSRSSPISLILCSTEDPRAIDVRSCSSGNGKPPVLMNFQPVVKPEILLSIKNWILTKIIIQPYLDSEFMIKEFVKGAKQAVDIISTYLANGDFVSLKGLVTDEAIEEIKLNHSLMNVKERQDLLVRVEDILFTFPYQVGIIFDDNSQQRFCEITVIYHILKGLKDIRNLEQKLSENAREEIIICNYRFIREYTKGVRSGWIVNRLGHFRLTHIEN